MAETLGSLCDKLTVVKLKQWHASEATKQESLALQERQLTEEIDTYLRDAADGTIPRERLTFAANKVHKDVGSSPLELAGSLGPLIAQLAQVNSDLWHTQEKVYDFASVPPAEKDAVIRQLALLNLDRNKCIDAIDRALVAALESRNSH